MTTDATLRPPPVHTVADVAGAGDIRARFVATEVSLRALAAHLGDSAGPDQAELQRLLEQAQGDVDANRELDYSAESELGAALQDTDRALRRLVKAVEKTADPYGAGRVVVFVNRAREQLDANDELREAGSGDALAGGIDATAVDAEAVAAYDEVLQSLEADEADELTEEGGVRP